MKTTITILVSSLLLAACAAEESGSLRRPGSPDDPSAPDAPPATPTDPNAPVQCAPGRDYEGFDAFKLTASRAPLQPGIDRGRVKPFSALQTEYARVLGSSPASLAKAGPTFGQAQARWFEEPEANAVALQTAYDIAFDGCLTFVATQPTMASAPDATSAAAACGSMARRFWSRTPSTAEIQSCVDVAVTGAATDPSASRKWAYACASLLTSANFMAY